MVDEMCSILHEKYPKKIWRLEYWMPVMVIECMDNIILLLDDLQLGDSLHQMTLSYEHLTFTLD